MYLYNLIKDIEGDVVMYVDMDGVMAEYDVMDQKHIAENTKDYFLNRRPIKTIIEILKKIKELPNVEMNILSSCRFLDQADDKKKWLEANAPFFDNQYLVIRTMRGMKTSSALKAQFLTENFEENKTILLLDDSHDVLRDVRDALSGKVKVIHVSTIFE